jgi:DUF4097 and DUF4098 domain-containing protein YvlB
MNARIFLPAAFLLVTAAAQATPQTYSKTFSVTGRPSVHVKVSDGSVTISPSQSSQVEFRVEYEGYKLGKDFRIEAAQHGDTIDLEARDMVRMRISVGLKIPRVHVEVRLPAESDLTVDSGDGAIDLASINGKISVRTGDGDIRTSALKGTVQLNTGDGDIEGKDLDGACDVTTGDGKVQLAGRFESLNIKSGDGAVDARVAAGSQMTTGWNIRSGDGPIRLELPDDFKANLNATTGDGEISLGLPVTVEGNTSRSRISGTINGGGPVLSIHTGDGAIKLTKS